MGLSNSPFQFPQFFPRFFLLLGVWFLLQVTFPQLQVSTRTKLDIFNGTILEVDLNILDCIYIFICKCSFENDVLSQKVGPGGGG